MVARPARRLDPTPAASEPTPFADAAMEMWSYGLAVIPLGYEKGLERSKDKKRTPALAWGAMTAPLGFVALSKMIPRHPDHNIGILTELSGLAVVDIDDPDLLDEMLARCGDTPLIIGTPRGGFHLYYKFNGEPSITKMDGLGVDIKATKAMVVAPPSIRPCGEHAGKSYTIIKGSWDDLRKLPVMKATAIRAPARAKAAAGRNDYIFYKSRHLAKQCGTKDGTVSGALAINALLDDPLGEAEVIRTAESAWSLEERGVNWIGSAGHVSLEFVNDLLNFRPRSGGDAWTLYCILKKNHGARVERGETFAIAARSMAGTVLPWGEHYIRKLTKILMEFGLLRRVHRGGVSKGDAAQYTFGSPRPFLGALGSNQYNIQPPAAPWHGG